MEIANVWNEEFGLSYDNEVSFYTSQKLIRACENVWQFARERKLSLSYILNSVNYDTYYGNFAHGICKKIFDILNLDDDVNIHFVITPYLNMLFYIVNQGIVNLEFRDYYNHTPMESCDFFKISLIRTYSTEAHGIIRLLRKILDPDYSIVIVIQKNVRRWLGKRKAQKQKLRIVLNNILYAPVKQIEFNLFPSFPGGTEYLQSCCRFEDNVIDEMVQMITI